MNNRPLNNRERLISGLASILGVKDMITPPTQGVGAQPSTGTALEDKPLPPSWQTAVYAPGFPIRPISKPLEEGIPRSIDYPISANVSIQPRTHYGLLPFQVLNDAYENIPEVTMAVHLLIRELCAFQPQLVDADENVLNDHPYLWMTETPDGITPWTVWLTRFMQSVFVYDAGALFTERGDSGLAGLHYVDGSTLFCLVDVQGNPPEAPHPAFTQVIKGTPFAWYTQKDLWYRPRFRRPNAPYGRSFIEMCWSWILILANIEGFELAHYREGNMPEGYVNAPRDWHIDQVASFEDAFNSRMSAGAAERNRVRFLPYGFTYKDTKKPDFPKDLYEHAKDNVFMAAGIPAAEYGKMPGAGLGGKGMGDLATTQLYRMGLAPAISYVTGAINDIFDQFGVDDAYMELGMPNENVDPEKHRKGVIEQFVNGLLTFNEARSQLSLDPLEEGYGDKYIFLKGGQLILMDQKMQIEVIGGQAGLPAAAAPTKEEAKLAEKMIRDGKPPSSFTSIPSGDGHKPEDEAVDTQKMEKAAKEAEDLAKWNDPIFKHCGVCPEDDAYFGALVAREVEFPFPDSFHANAVEIVALVPPSLSPRPALWKPEGGEMEQLVEYIGGWQYVREEAAYLVDRSLEFFLVPVAYVTEVDGERGAALHYVRGNIPPKNLKEYDVKWLEKAAVLDYILGNVDRHAGNWLTHPEDTTRPILIDNGLSFPTRKMYIRSPFTTIWQGVALSKEVLSDIKRFVGDSATWQDLIELVGSDAAGLAMDRAKKLLDTGVIKDDLVPKPTESANWQTTAQETVTQTTKEEG
jgi:hypothetical protein